MEPPFDFDNESMKVITNMNSSVNPADRASFNKALEIAYKQMYKIKCEHKLKKPDSTIR